jgi:hypothetical protein
MIFGALAIAVPASASPDSPPPHNCALSFSSSVSTQSTNATVSFEATVSPSGCWTGNVYITLTWGNSPSYPFTDINGGAYSLNTVYYAPLLDYLEPGTTYYYHLHGTFGIYSGNYYGLWPTGGDSSTYFLGQIKGQAGGNAPAGDEVQLVCLSSSYADLGFYAQSTTPGGFYGFNAPGWPYGSGPCAKYEISYLNPGTVGTPWQNAPVWTGQWNESAIVYAPGWYDLYSQVNYKTYVPASAEFVHTSYADISSYSAEIYTTTGSSWNYGGYSGSTSETAKAGWGTNSVPFGSNLRVDSEYWTSGTGLFDATNGRQASLSGLNFFDQTGASFNVNGWTDWQTSAPANGFCEPFNSPSATYTLTLSGKTTVASGYDIDVGVSAGPASASVPIQNTLESTSGYSTQVVFTLDNPYYPGYAYYLINTEGGSYPWSDQAIVAHVWLVNGC